VSGDALNCHLLSFVLSFGELKSRGRQIRRFLVDGKAHHIFQPVPTFSVRISLSDWLGCTQED
jgi:hypothetical protein